MPRMLAKVRLLLIRLMIKPGVPKISSRMAIPRSGIREIAEKAWEMKKRGIEVINLSIGIPDGPEPERVAEALRKLKAGDANRYSANAGLPELQETVLRHLQEKEGWNGLSRDNITIVDGGMEGLFGSLATTAKIGQRVLMPEITWPNHGHMQKILGIKPALYPLSDFQPDIEKIESLITRKTRALLINTPTNPTGVVLSRETIQRLVEISKRYGLWLISDESYKDIVFEGKHISPAEFDPKLKNTIVVRSLSKSYNMTGYRIGYVVARKDVSQALIQANENIIACAAVPCQYAAIAALEGDSAEEEVKLIESYRTRRNVALEILEEFNLYEYSPQGAFYLMINISHSDLNSDEFADRLLEEKHVAVAPGSTFGEAAAHYIRICFAASLEDVKEGTKRVCEFIKNP